MTDAQHEVSLLGDWMAWDPASLPPSGRNFLVPFLTWMFADLQPSLCVELGSNEGDTFRALCQIGDRFSPQSRLVAIDSWATAQSSAPLTQSAYEGLCEYCRTHHAARASVVRAQLLAAVSEFDDGGIDFLHIARVDETMGSSPLDLNLWTPKLAENAVVVVTGAQTRQIDDVMRKVWQQLSDTYPSVLLHFPGPVGIAQRPGNGEAHLVQFIRSRSDEFSSLFRLLGERTGYRHVVSSEPLSAAGIQGYISDLTRDHAGDVRRIRDQHQTRIEGIEGQLASVTDRALETSNQMKELQIEADFLLAQLASRSASYEDERARLQATIDQLRGKVVEQEHALAERSAYIGAVTNTVSWRVTRPLRAVQTRLIRAKMDRRSG